MIEALKRVAAWWVGAAIRTFLILLIEAVLFMRLAVPAVGVVLGIKAIIWLARIIF